MHHSPAPPAAPTGRREAHRNYSTDSGRRDEEARVTSEGKVSVVQVGRPQPDRKAASTVQIPAYMPVPPAPRKTSGRRWTDSPRRSAA